MKYAILFLMTPGSFVAVGFVGVAFKRVAKRIIPEAAIVGMLTLTRASIEAERLDSVAIENAIELLIDG